MLGWAVLDQPEVPGVTRPTLYAPVASNPGLTRSTSLKKEWIYLPTGETYKSVTKSGAMAAFESNLRSENPGARVVGERVKEEDVVELSEYLATLDESRLRRFIREVLTESIGSDLMNRGIVVELSSPVSLVHRSSNPDLRVSGFAPLAQRASKQRTRSDDYQVGLYAYESKHDVPRYGENKIEFTLPVGTRVLDLTEAGRGATSRIPVSQARKLLDAGVKAVKGYDYIGPPEWVVLEMP
jgi:hypothetical protein